MAWRYSFERRRESVRARPCCRPRFRGWVAACALLLSLPVTPSVAQTLARATEERGQVGLLTQADVTVENSAAQVGLQAVELFITGNERKGFAKVYVRTTLPMAEDKPEAQAAGGADGEVAALTPAAVAGLLDPYGGILNLTGGYWRKLATGRDAKGEVDEDGLFLDARSGIKLINLPEQAVNSPAFAGTRVTPFYTWSLVGRFSHRLYSDAEKPKRTKETAAGRIEAGFGLVGNHASDSTLSAAFSNGLLTNNTLAISGSLTLTVNGALAVTISASPWSHNGAATPFGKHFTVGLKVLNSPS